MYILYTLLIGHYIWLWGGASVIFGEKQTPETKLQEKRAGRNAPERILSSSEACAGVHAFITRIVNKILKENTTLTKHQRSNVRFAAKLVIDKYLGQAQTALDANMVAPVIKAHIATILYIFIPTIIGGNDDHIEQGLIRNFSMVLDVIQHRTSTMPEVGFKTRGRLGHAIARADLMAVELPGRRLAFVTAVGKQVIQTNWHLDTRTDACSFYLLPNGHILVESPLAVGSDDPAFTFSVFNAQGQYVSVYHDPGYAYHQTHSMQEPAIDQICTISPNGDDTSTDEDIPANPTPRYTLRYDKDGRAKRMRRATQSKTTH